MKLSKEKLFSILKNAKMYKDNNINASCAWCGQNEFYISLNDNHPWQCWRKSKCEADRGNIYKLLEKLNIYDLYNVKEDIKWQSNVSETLQIDLKQEINVDILNEVRLPVGFKRIYSDNYLQSRGFKVNDFNNHTIGITKLDQALINYVIFIIHQDNQPVAYVGRFKGTKKECDSLKKPRYKNSDSDFVKILGNYDLLVKGITKTVILCEGLFDSKNINELLHIANDITIKSCFTFKGHISEEQIYRLQLKEIENIILLYDSDILNSIKEQAFNLVKHFNVKICLIEVKNYDGSIKDAAELNYAEFIDVMKKIYLPLEFYMKKVQLLNL